MAKTNKYSSINFNHIFEKKSNPNPTTTSTATINANTATTNKPISSSLAHRTHGGMLVLTRPTPKPLPIIQSPKPPTPSEPEPTPDPVSLRPLGRTGSSSLPSHTPEPLPPSKPEPFVPPHLRPGFVGKEQKIGQNGQKNQNRLAQVGSPSRYGQDGRPKSGGHERMRRGPDVDLPDVNRPSSSGNRRPGSGGGRPGSSGGWYGSSPSSYRSSRY